MGVKEITFKRIAQVTDELIRYSPATAMKIHQLGYDDVEKIEAELNAMERPEYKERREQLERMNNIIKTSNMVDVVRCRECKNSYFATNGLKANEDICSKHKMAVTPEWFCADGERKE